MYWPDILNDSLNLRRAEEEEEKEGKQMNVADLWKYKIEVKKILAKNKVNSGKEVER